MVTVFVMKIETVAWWDRNDSKCYWIKKQIEPVHSYP